MENYIARWGGVAYERKSRYGLIKVANTVKD